MGYPSTKEDIEEKAVSNSSENWMKRFDGFLRKHSKYCYSKNTQANDYKEVIEELNKLRPLLENPNLDLAKENLQLKNKILLLECELISLKHKLSTK